MLAEVVALAGTGTPPLTPTQLTGPILIAASAVTVRELRPTLVSALEGDNAPLARLVAEADLIEAAAVSDGESDVAGVLAYFCNQDVALPYDRALSRQARETALSAWWDGPGRDLQAPFDARVWAARVPSLANVCIGWPASTELEPPVPPGDLPDVPTLIIAGGADETTPIEDGRAVPECDRAGGPVW
jgi:pimeloyl-ACP methyl ester carboxylesterase